MGLPDGVLPYKILNNAEISEHHKQLVQDTLSELKYNTIKEQLKKVFSGPSNFPWSIKGEQNIKIELISNTEDLYYKNCYSKRYNPRFRGNRCNTNNKNSENQSSHLIKINPRNKDGEITKCNLCGSIYHWTKSCRDSNKNHMKIKEKKNITLIGECTETLIGEH